MKKRAGFKKITVNGKIYQFAWSLRHGLPRAWPLLTVYTEDNKRFEIDAGNYTIPPKPDGRLATWKGKNGTAGWDTYEANFIIMTAKI